ncbi:lipopolysaccharide/colanic/teichoic acid biosynthesis glycosyltransferase [Kitasatospora sp. MAP12-15]|uniref:sugar transferase n=1 Tax=unclassified Kitasatospora TaxID=2633591 RepID=UPI0024749254|nr:sugar transferase [Kitasatospora sp. MAP12-44]MDH6108527.1 lipopolysaccharide/colanic/teichoic acid biosynthesis glycosyltransferase [Kitasatospora sp. MAP12-44]
MALASRPRVSQPPQPQPQPQPRWPGRARRFLDVVTGLSALLLLSPLLLVLAVVVRASSAGPVLFRQQRVGERGRLFTLYKFRSMRAGATGPEVTGRGDPRVTRVGRLLRATSLDELPQLLNLLRGDMTLVGPRPETPALARRYPPQCRWVFAYRPGLTGPVQLRANELAAAPQGVADPEAYYLEVLVPQRVALDSEYLATSSIAGDLAVVLRTVGHLLALRRLLPPAH